MCSRRQNPVSANGPVKPGAASLILDARPKLGVDFRDVVLNPRIEGVMQAPEDVRPQPFPVAALFELRITVKNCW